MKQLLISILFVNLILLSFSCEKSTEQKENKIEENKLQNSAYRKEIKADSLLRQADELENQAKQLKKEAGQLKDSARSI
jgi:hypothetical protein